MAEEKKAKKKTNSSKKAEPKKEVVLEEVKEEIVEEKKEETIEEKPEEKKDEKLEEKAKLSKQEKKEQKKAEKENKRRFGDIMSTGSFIRMFILLLIPGINIILIIFWALGAARNRNRINLSRALIVFFIIEVLLVSLLFGIGYIYIDRKEAAVINYLDKYSNGVLTYFDIDSYDDLVKLRNISDYLVEKTEPEEDTPEPEVIIPKTCYIYNPEGIASYQQFVELYNAQFPDETSTEIAVAENSLFAILEANNVDTKDSKLIYIIIDNETENSVIVFDPTGKFQSYPTIEVNGEYVCVGGAK